MTVKQFEAAVWDVEGIRVVVRALGGTTVGDYNYANAASAASSISDWLKTRVTPKLATHEVVVINGDGLPPHGRTSLDKVRKSYGSV